MKRVLIFGASGFVGHYLIDEFYNNGYEVFGSDLVDEYKNPHCSYKKCDILSTEGVLQLISEVNPSYIVNLAAISSVGLSWKIPQKTIMVNTIGTVNVLEAVKAVDTSIKVLIIGSSEEYKQKDTPLTTNDPLDGNNPYGISKIMQERMASIYSSRYGIRIIFTRSFNHTGPGQKDTFVIPSFCHQVAMIEKSGKSGIIKVGNLSAIRDISDVRDVVHVYRLLVEEYDTGVFNVGSGKAESIGDILKIIISFSNQKINVVQNQDLFRFVDTPFICNGEKPSFDFTFRPLKETLFDTFDFELRL
jgi:GDP-4-dehydro-6-deoxy-D-mannose reductase